jgi:Asp/Glu/hydantoin racemase
VIAAHAVLEAIADNTDCGAAIIGAFGDPGLEAAEEIAPMPVFGLGRSGLHAAGRDRRAFAIITLGPQLRTDIVRATVAADVADQVVALRFLDGGVLGLADDRRAFLNAMISAVEDCVAAGAEAILFGGAPFAGIARDLAGHVAVPVVDGLTSAVQDAHVAIGSEQPRHRTGGGAAGKPMRNISSRLENLIAAMLAQKARDAH